MTVLVPQTASAPLTVVRALAQGAPLAALHDELTAAAEQILNGQATEVAIASLLTAVQLLEDPTPALKVFAKVLRDKATPFRAPDNEPVIDTCGTGGDHSGTFNVSTAAAFVVAGAGVRVAKHGNRSITSRCGSADVLAALGVNIEADTVAMETALAKTGIAFLFAPKYHSAMRHVGAVRRELGFRTLFNLVGPLANPARVPYQIIGVFSPAVMRPVAETTLSLGLKRALIVHGTDGLDEITIRADTTALLADGERGTITELTISPELGGLARRTEAELGGGDAWDNSGMIVDLLTGKASDAVRDTVLLNAGAAIWVAGQAADLADGVARARTALDSGQASQALVEFQKIVPKPTGE